MPTLSGKVPQILLIPKSCLAISAQQVTAKPNTFIPCARICKMLCLPYTSILSMEICIRKSLFFLVVGKLAHFKKAPIVYSMTCQILFITTLLTSEKNCVCSFQVAKQIMSSGCGKQPWRTRTVCEDCVLSFRTNVLSPFLSCSSASPFTSLLSMVAQARASHLL